MPERRQNSSLHSSLIDAVLEGALMGLLAGVVLLLALSDLRALLVSQAGLVGLGSYLFVCAQSGAVLAVIGLVMLGIPATPLLRWNGGSKKA